MDLTAKVKAKAIELGADKVGVASVDNLLETGLPEGQKPKDMLPGAKTLVSFIIAGIPIPRLDHINENGYPLGAPEASINFVLLGSGWPDATLGDFISYRLARLLIAEGYKALPIPAGHPYDKKNLRGIISQKHAAVQAGIGEIALSTLLITPEYGCNVFPCSLLTDADLELDELLEEKICEPYRETCGLACVKACPVAAIKSDGTLDKQACLKHTYEGIGKNFEYPEHQHLMRCCVCIRHCPVSRLY